MTGNQLNRKDARRNVDVSSGRNAPGEKPVLNEPWDSHAVPVDVALKKATPLGATNKSGEAKRSPQPEFSDDSKFRKAMRLYLTKRWESAMDEFLQVDSQHFDKEQKAELAYYLGLCSTKLERFEDALMYLEQVIAVDDSPLRVYQCRMISAYVYIVTNHADLAESELNRLQGGGLESVMLYNTLAYAAYVQKHHIAAMEYYEKALEIDSENTTALNSLGFILVDSGLDKLKGLRLCRKAADKNPENAAYLDSLGWASYKCGNIKDAGKWLRQALELAPHEPEIKKHFKIVTGGAL